ncbi:MAG: glycosyltransferase family 39 protein [Chloroflexi bacterium]|nr:glycosyltransferase family 39 protein [Chloroflexota bacterium]
MNPKWRTGGMKPAFLAMAAVVVFSALGFALRVYNVGNQSIWADEMYTMQYARMGFLDILRFQLATFDPHAPLFMFIERLWVPIAGDNALSFRFPTIFFGVLLIPTLALLGRLMTRPAVGILAALLLVANPFHVWYAQEARTYTVTAFLVAVSTALFVKIVTRRTNAVVWASYVIVTTLSVYSHYFSFLIVLSQNLGFLLLWRKRKLNLWHWLGAQAMFVVPYLPWVGFAAELVLRHITEETAKPFWGVWPLLAQAFSIGWFISPNRLPWFPAFIGLICVAALSVAVPRVKADVEGRMTPGQALSILILSILVPVIGAYSYYVMTGRYFVQERYLIISSPAFTLTIALGLLQLRRLANFLPVLLGLGLVGLQLVSLFSLYTRFPKPDYPGVAKYIEQNEREGDAIVVMGDVVSLAFSFYYEGGLPVGNISDSLPDEKIAEMLDDVVGSHSRVWFLPYGDRPFDNDVEAWLDNHAFKMENRWMKTARYVLYSTSAGLPRSVRQLGQEFESGVELTSYSLTSDQLAPGDAVQLSLQWKSLRDGSQDFKVSVRLTDEEGHIVNQFDRRPADDKRSTLSWVAGESMTDNLGIMIPAGSPPGQYGLELGLYNIATGQPLRSVAREGQRSLALVSLQPVTVVGSGSLATEAYLRVGQMVSANFGSLIRLLGFDRLRASATPGDRLSVAGYWQALTAADRDYSAVFRFVGRDMPASAEATDAIGPPSFRTSRWQSGQTVRDFMDIVLPKRLQSGTYDVFLAVTDGSVELQPSQSDQLLLGTVQVRSRQRSFKAPKPEQPYSARFGEVAEFLGYDLKPVRRDQPAILALYWRSLRETDTSYTVFVHLLDRGEKVVAQSDSTPASGATPTTSWVAGEIVADRHVIALPGDLPPGVYQIEVGLYDATTGVRLRGDGGEDRILPGEVVLP